MMRLWHTALLLLLPLATLPPSGPVQAQAPARDANDRPPVRATIPSGTNVVGGIVVSENSPARPIRRVVVNLISPDSSVPLSTLTDDDGRFVFDAVPDGTYGLSASKAGWVGAFFGSTRAGHGPGVPLAVRSGERLTDLVLTLTRGAVIAGTVRLPDGRPAENMAVFVSGVQMVAGHPRLRLTGGRSTTDDRGRYRVYGLPAGDYVIQVRPSGFLAGVPTGTTDAPQTTASEVSWAQEVARLRAGRTASTAAGPAHGRTMAYAPVVFPGSADPSRANIVSIAAGEERDGVDFPMVLVPAARISGLVLGPDGLALADARISLTSTSDAPDILALLAPRDPIRSAADGTFSLRAVPPGRYRISARRALDAAAARASSPANGGAAGVRTMAAAGGGDASSGGELWADQDVIVDGEDVSTVTLVTQPGVTLSGRIVFDATTLDAPSDEDVARGKVAVVPVQAAASAAEAIASASVAIAGRIDAGGEFLVVGVVPGRYRLSVLIPGVRPNPAAPGRGWTIRSAMSSGVDLADTALVVESGRDVGGIEVTVTDRAPELIGSLTDAANRPVSGFPIVVFSTNRADWRIGSRRIAVARPATDGTFRLFGLPSGRYYVAAAVDLMQDDLDDPEFYEQLLPGALAVTLTEGTRTVQDLRLAP